MYSFVFLSATSLLICLGLTPLCRDLFLRAGWLDHPDQGRKTHARAVPRAGGIAIAVAYVGSFLLLLFSPLDGGSVLKQHLPMVWKLLPAVAIIFATGLVDDLAGLKSWQKLVGQIAAGLAAYGGGIEVFGSLPLTVAWLVFCTNAFNLIDGVDGLAAGLGLFATVTTLITSLLQGNFALAVATAPLAGALLGFLRYNFNPASVFLGDSGSLLVGFLLGCYGAIWSQKSATLLAMTAPLMALAIPILDTGLSIVRRFLRLQPIFGADRGHIHHRLLDRGLSPRRVALLLYAAGGLAAVFSIGQTFVHNRMALALLGGFLACAVTFVGSLGYVEFGAARSVLLGGAVRRLVGARIHLQNLENALACASTPNDCWVAIRDAARHLGFHHVRVHLIGESYQEQFRPGAIPDCWSIRIPLSAADYVNCAREVDGVVESAGIDSFAQVLCDKMRARLPHLRPSGSVDPQIAALAGQGQAGSPAPLHAFPSFH